MADRFKNLAEWDGKDPDPSYLLSFRAREKEVGTPHEGVSPPVPKSPTKWVVNNSKSAMTDDKTVIMSLESENDIPGRFGVSGPASLIVRCHENTTSIYFVLAGHYLAEIQGHDKVAYRLDSEKPSTTRFSVSTDNEAMGLWSGGRAIPFLKNMLGKDQMVVRLTPYSESPVEMTFKISGMDEAIKDLRNTCGW